MANNKASYSEDIQHFLYFVFNFPSNFMDAFKMLDEHIQSHIHSKWGDMYEKHGPSLGMIKFYMELDGEKRELLTTWVDHNYTGYTRKTE